MNKFKLFHLVILCFIFISGEIYAGDKVDNALSHIPVRMHGKTVDMSLKQAMDHFKVPSVSVSVVQGNSLLKVYSEGYTSSLHVKKVNNDTLYQAGSLSKSVAAILALRLVDLGTLTADGDIGLALKGWKITKSEKYKNYPITLRQLLSMSSGLDTGGYYGYSSLDKLPTVIDILSGKIPANNSALKLIYKPGSRYYYSGGGYEVVELLIDSVNPITFTATAQKELFQPLQMKHSYFDQPLPLTLYNNAAEATDEGGKGFADRWRISPELAAAGLWTTSEDLAKFVMAINESYHGTSKAILSVDLAKQALKRQKNTKYGMGFAIAGQGNKLHYMKLGQNVGYQGWLVGYPVTGQGAVVLTNSDNGRELAQDIMYALAKFYHWPTSGKLMDAWMLDN